MDRTEPDGEGAPAVPDRPPGRPGPAPRPGAPTARPWTPPDAAVLDALADGLTVADVTLPGQPLVYASRAFLRLTGYSADEVMGRNCRFLQGPDTDRAVRERIGSAIRAREPLTVELVNYRKDGSAFWNELKLSPVTEADGSVHRYIGLQSDVTDRRAREREVERRASRDPLTGLCNRSHLFARLERAMVGGGRDDALHALFVDLDGFKRINDAFGHGTGDALLVETARRLRASVRADDTVARLGGDEFVVIVGGSIDRAAAVAHRILAGLRAPFAVDGDTHRLSGSVGIAAWPGDAHDPDSLLERADAAMYRAKAAGRDRLAVFDPSAPGRAGASVEVP